MLRGLYSAASGMIAEGVRTDTIANNLANVDTAGFKKDTTVTSEFREMLLKRINDGADTPTIGSMGTGAEAVANVTNYSTGIFKTTDNPLDMAIEGDGFFVVNAPQGVRYTRDGSFRLNDQNQLVTADGFRVQGQNGAPIVAEANTGSVQVDAIGRVFSAGQEIGQLEMVSFPNKQQLAKEGSNLFRTTTANAAQQPFTGKVRQGALEGSNVNVVQEMVNMISSYRAYEIHSKAVQTHDALADKAINEVAKA